MENWTPSPPLPETYLFLYPMGSGSVRRMIIKQHQRLEKLTILEYMLPLSLLMIKKLYGGGKGDFNQKSIEFSYSTDFELPKVVDVYFLDDGLPVSLATSGTHRFDVGDIIDVNATISNLTQMGTGHYQFELSPDDNSSPANLFVLINGSGVKTDGFGDTFKMPISAFL